MLPTSDGINTLKLLKYNGVNHLDEHEVRPEQSGVRSLEGITV